MSFARGTREHRLLVRLVRSGVTLVSHADGFSLRDTGKSVAVNAEVVQALEAHGLLLACGEVRIVSAAGVAFVRRSLAAVDPYQEQHQERARERICDATDNFTDVMKNRQESPLAWLRARRGRDGRPMVDAAEFEAGERLRADFTRGGMMPSITANWCPVVTRNGSSGGAGGAAQLAEAALSARLRVDSALRAVGPELSGVLVDVCCFLKKMEEVEQQRGWPARSGKVMLRAALSALARHYGLTPLARGRDDGGRIVHWGAEGYRPVID